MRRNIQQRIGQGVGTSRKPSDRSRNGGGQRRRITQLIAIEDEKLFISVNYARESVGKVAYLKELRQVRAFEIAQHIRLRKPHICKQK